MVINNRLNNKLLSAISALLFQIMLLGQTAEIISSFVTNYMGGLTLSSDLVWLLVCLGLDLAVILVYIHFFRELFRIYKDAIRKTAFTLSLIAGCISLSVPGLLAAHTVIFGIPQSVGLFASVELVGLVILWVFAIIHLLALRYAFSNLLSKRAKRLLLIPIFFKAICLAAGIVRGMFLLLFYAGGNTEIVSNMQLLALALLAPASLLHLDVIVYCTVLLFVFWNFFSRGQSNEKGLL